jgi:kynureninase
MLMADVVKVRNLEIITPEAIQEHGCQLSMYAKTNGKKLFDHLTENGVIADWREPDVIRLAPVPLYNSYYDVWRLYNVLKNYKG